MFGKIVTVESERQYPIDKTKCETGIIAKMKLLDGAPILIDGMSHVPGEERAFIEPPPENEPTACKWISGELFGY